MISVGPGASDIDKGRRGGYVSRQQAEGRAAYGLARYRASMTPQQHARAAMIASQVGAYYDTIPRAHLVVLDWSHGHERSRPGECCHCHSPALTNLIDNDGRYSHKLCAEIADYLAGPEPEPTDTTEETAP